MSEDQQLDNAFLFIVLREFSIDSCFEYYIFIQSSSYTDHKNDQDPSQSSKSCEKNDTVRRVSWRKSEVNSR